MKVGVNYMSAGNAGADTDAQLNADFAFFKAHKISYVDARLVWAAFYPSGTHTISQTALSNYKRLIAAAKAQGLLVGISFWSHFQDSSWSRPSWAGTASQMYSNPTIKQYWLDFVHAAAEALEDPSIAYWQVLNEPYCGLSSRPQLEALIRDTAQAIRQHSQAEISCRFIMGWNPYLPPINPVESDIYFDPSVMDYLDFLSLTTYQNPNASDTEMNTSSRATWNFTKATIEAARADGKPVYIVEFGNNSTNDETQRSTYQSYLFNRFQPYGIAAAMAWAWQTRSPTAELYNISRGQANARPAFYELEAAAEETPTPECFFNADCEAKYGAGWTCQDGVCVPPVPECDIDADCEAKYGAGWTCQSGVCKPPVTPPPTKYTVTVIVTLGGTTQPAPGSYIVNAGEKLTIYALPAEGYDFSGWVQDGVKVPGTAGIMPIRTVTPLANMTVEATFTVETTPPTPPSPCFIATAAYGSPLDVHLDTFRAFRDKNMPDKLVNAYYRVSPPLANFIRSRKPVKRFTRTTLDMIEKILRREKHGQC